jgi:sugar phosphate isomerase/epimerase
MEICQFNIPSTDPAYLAQLKSAITAAGTHATNMPIDVGNISVANDQYREDDLREIESWIDIAAGLGCTMVRVNASAPMSKEPLGPLDVTIASYRRLAGYAAQRGLTMLVENHGGITEDPQVILEILKGVGIDKIKACVDVGNFPPVMGAQMRGLKPGEYDPTPLYDAVAAIAPYAGILHAKTMSFDEQGNHLGWDVVRALRIVRDAGFHGDVSIEYGGGVDAWDACLKTKALIEQAYSA